MFQYELPTTGAITFNELCADQSSGVVCSSHLSEATQIRANLRGALKDNKRSNDEGDYLKLVKVTVLNDRLQPLSTSSRFSTNIFLTFSQSSTV
jgi:predicted Zn-dependent protease